MMNDGINIEQRDIVLIPFPFSDLKASKKRPALILSGKEYNSNNADFICCAITSNPKDRDNNICIANSDLERGTLLPDCKIKAGKIFTAYRQIIIKNIGKLNIAKSKEAVEQLKNCITIEE